MGDRELALQLKNWSEKMNYSNHAKTDDNMTCIVQNENNFIGFNFINLNIYLITTL